MKNIIIGFDGLTRAGKTTLIKKLASIFNASVIEEQREYLEPGSKFPKFPPESYEKAMEASVFFMNIEKKRISDLEGYESSNTKLIFIDRTYLSCLAFDYAANYVTSFGTFQEVQKLWLGMEKIVPDVTFFMDVSQDNLRNRMLLNGDNLPSHFLDKDFNEHMMDFFKQECEKNNMIRIDANKKPEEVEGEISAIILTYLADHQE